MSKPTTKPTTKRSNTSPFRLDLRDETDPFLLATKCATENQRRIIQSRDVCDVMGHPLCVGTLIAANSLVLIAGLVIWRRHASGAVPHLGEIWWFSSILMMIIVVMGCLLPVRIRFGCNWYGIMTALLFIEYIAFVSCYPLSMPSGEDFAIFKRAVQEKREEQVQLQH